MYHQAVFIKQCSLSQEDRKIGESEVKQTHGAWIKYSPAARSHRMRLVERHFETIRQRHINLYT
jgi:hypothetical protein